MDEIIFCRLLFFVPERIRTFGWLLLSVISLSLSYVTGIIIEENLGLFLNLAAVSIGFISLPVAFIYCRAQLLHLTRFFDNFVSGNPSEATAWFTNELRFFRGNRWMYIFGFITSGLAAFSTYGGGFFEPLQHLTSLIVSCSMLIASAFMAGMGLFAIFSGCRAIFRFGSKYDVIVESHKFGVLMIGRVLARCYVAIGVTWSFYVLSAFAGATSVTVNMYFPLLLLAIPTFCFFMISFVVCQLSLHENMVEFKRRKLLRLQECISRHEFVGGRQPSLDDLQMLELLRKEKRYVLSLPEWPFSVQAMGALLAASLTSVWPAILTTAVSKWLENFLQSGGAP